MVMVMVGGHAGVGWRWWWMRMWLAGDRTAKMLNTRSDSDNGSEDGVSVRGWC